MFSYIEVPLPFIIFPLIIARIFWEEGCVWDWKMQATEFDHAKLITPCFPQNVYGVREILLLSEILR